MSTLIQTFEDLMTSEVADKIDLKLTEIKQCFDWSKFDAGISIKDIDISNINQEDIIEQKTILENIAKLSINLYNDFEFFGLFIFESQFQSIFYNELLSQLGYACVEGKWHCVQRPDSLVVHRILFLSCCYQLLANKMTEMITNCDSGICDVCDTCDSDVDTVYNVGRNLAEVSVSLRDSGGGDNEERVGSSHESNAEEWMYKWQCSMCDSYNNYGIAICEVCNEEFENCKWKCQHCFVENYCRNNRCSNCNRTNPNLSTVTLEPIAVASDSRRVVDEPSVTDDTPVCPIDVIDSRIANKWWCRKCVMYHAYDVGVCTQCTVSRTAIGQWSCAFCTLINKCADVKCDACERPNDALLSKYCNTCNRNKITIDAELCDSCARPSINTNLDQPDRWRCMFSYCRQWNPNSEDYCSKCKLWRHGSHVRGDLIKQMTPQGEMQVWVCDKCHRANGSASTVCAVQNCGETRFKIKYCYGCVKYNDGKSLNCDKCNKRL